MHVEIPDKLYFKIGEVAKLLDVPTHVLRYWESEFEEITPKRAVSNQRLYRREDVLLLVKIRTLLYDRGFTIAGARKHIESGEELELPSPAIEKDDAAAALIGEMKDELLELQQFIQKKS